MCMHSMSHQDHAAHSDSAHSVREESPLDIIKRRYASGEISKEQFAQLRHDLAADASPPGSSGHIHADRE